MSIRLLLYSVPGGPCFEVSQRFSEFHNLPFYTIEKDLFLGTDYFSDNIPSTTLDTGDLTSGSEETRYVRDPSSLDKDKLLDTPCTVSIDYLSLDDSEISEITKIDQGVVCTEIPDTRLVDWSTHVIFFNSSENEAIKWFSQRLKCTTCGNVHHLSDKPPRFPGICDRCGTDLIIRKSDRPNSIKRQFMDWRQSFWRLKNESEKQDKLHIYSIDKFDCLEQLIKKVDLDYRKYLTKPLNWYSEFSSDMHGSGSGPCDL